MLRLHGGHDIDRDYRTLAGMHAHIPQVSTFQEIVVPVGVVIRRVCRWRCCEFHWIFILLTKQFGHCSYEHEVPSVESVS